MHLPQPAAPKTGGMIRKTELATRIATALLGIALAVFSGYVGLFRLGSSVVSLSYDMPFMVHQAGGAEQLRLVYLNVHAGDVLDRGTQAELLERLGAAGAKAVLYDIFFNTASQDPAVDQQFAAAIRQFRGVDGEGKPLPGVPQRLVLLACERQLSREVGFAGERLVAPTPVLRKAANSYGVTVIDDDAYTARKLPTGTSEKASMIWQAAIALGANLNDKDRLAPRWINYVGPPPDPTNPDAVMPVSACGAASLLDGSANPAIFKDKIVVIGGEPGLLGQAPGKDLFYTPFHRFQLGGKLPLMSGVEVQANALANLLEHNWLTRSNSRWEMAMIVVAGILLGSLFTLIRPVRAVATAVGVVLAASLVGILTLRYGHLWFPWSVVAFLQVPVALVWGLAAQSYVERFFRIKLTKDQIVMRAAFAKYLSPQMLDRLTETNFSTNLGGEKIHAAMMFTDLESFTDMCERIHNPERVVEILNDYFERATGSIFDDDGIIIKFIGDAIFAAWGTPLIDPEAPVKAVHAAWRLFENKLVVDGLELKTRIGLHFGEVVAGNVGSSRRVDYTLIGDAVNLAARLEALNKMFDTSILMSGAVHCHLGTEFRTRRVGKFCVKGRQEPVEVYELLGPTWQTEEPAWIGLYHQALAALEADDIPLAMERFTAVHPSRGQNDGPSKFFIERLQSDPTIRGGIVELKEK